MSSLNHDRFSICELDSKDPISCACGTTRRAFVDDPDRIASLHVVDVSENTTMHYHKSMTEIYYVLEGHGEIRLDDQVFSLKPGMAILIKPGCRHQAIGNLKILNVPIPAFDPSDEFFD